MLVIQILLVVFAWFAIFKTIQRFRASEVGRGVLASWILFWLLVIIVALLPDTASALAKLFGVGRGADLVVYLALALLFYLLFRFNIKLEKISREITTLTRELSLRPDDKK